MAHQSLPKAPPFLQNPPLSMNRTLAIQVQLIGEVQNAECKVQSPLAIGYWLSAIRYEPAARCPVHGPNASRACGCASTGASELSSQLSVSRGSPLRGERWNLGHRSQMADGRGLSGFGDRYGPCGQDLPQPSGRNVLGGAFLAGAVEGRSGASTRRSRPPKAGLVAGCARWPSTIRPEATPC